MPSFLLGDSSRSPRLSFLSVTCVILGFLGLSLTLYVHRPNSNRPDIWGVVFYVKAKVGRFPALVPKTQKRYNKD